jgi:hypothetical protein
MKPPQQHPKTRLWIEISQIYFQTFSERLASHFEMPIFYAVTETHRKPKKASEEHSHAENNLEMGNYDHNHYRHNQTRNAINPKQGSGCQAYRK